MYLEYGNDREDNTLRQLDGLRASQLNAMNVHKDQRLPSAVSVGRSCGDLAVADPYLKV